MRIIYLNKIIELNNKKIWKEPHIIEVKDTTMKKTNVKTVAQLIENPLENTKILIEQIIADGFLKMPDVSDLEVFDYMESDVETGPKGNKVKKYWHKLKARSITQYNYLEEEGMEDKCTVYVINLPLTLEPLIENHENFEAKFAGQDFLAGQELELQFKAKVLKNGSATNVIEFRIKD